MKRRLKIVETFIIHPTLLFGLLVSWDCEARIYDVYRSDYAKGAFCSVIAGACSADTSIESAFFQNPASLVIGQDDFGFDGDYNQSSSLEPGMKGSNSVGEAQYLFGIGTRHGKFGVGLGIFGRTTDVDSQVTVYDEQNIPRQFPLRTDSNHIEFNIPLAYQFETVEVGVSLVGAYTDFSFASTGSRLNKSNSGFNFGFAAGVITSLSPEVRFGTWFRSSVTNYASVALDQDILGSTLHYSEDLAIHTPWILANGVAYKTGDKSELSFDLDMIGSTSQGLQLTYDTFSTALGDRGVRPKGRFLTFEPRLGFKTPWPAIEQDKGTLFFGIYLEPSRWDGLASRVHETFGVAHQTFSFIELMAGVDVARDFFQIFLTFR